MGTKRFIRKLLKKLVEELKPILSYLPYVGEDHYFMMGDLLPCQDRSSCGGIGPIRRKVVELMDNGESAGSIYMPRGKRIILYLDTKEKQFLVAAQCRIGYYHILPYEISWERWGKFPCDDANNIVATLRDRVTAKYQEYE